MPPSESLYPPDWLRVAEEDFQRIEGRLALNDPADAGLHLQQAVEKFLKTFLLSRGWRLRRIHDLAILLDEALMYEPSLVGYRPACQTVTAFYFAERHPFTIQMHPAEQDVRVALGQLQGLIDFVRRSVR